MLIYNAVCWFTTQNSDWIRGVLNDYVLCWSNKQHVDCLRCVDWLHGLLMTLPCVDWLCKYALWWMTIDYELHWLSVHCFDLLCIVLKDHCCFHWLCTVCIDFAMYWLTTLLRLGYCFDHDDWITKKNLIQRPFSPTQSLVFVFQISSTEKAKN